MVREEIVKALEDAIKEIKCEVDSWRRKVGAPDTQDLECLNLIMKKENALRILSGEKNVEYRPCTSYYRDRLYDKNVENFYERHKEDESIAREFCHYGFLDALRRVKKIHFHNYSNTWYLDVELVSNGYVMGTSIN